MFLIQIFICIFASDELSAPQSPRPELLVIQPDHWESPERWPEYVQISNTINPPFAVPQTLVPSFQPDAAELNDPVEFEMVEEISPRRSENILSPGSPESPRPESLVKERDRSEPPQLWLQYVPAFSVNPPLAVKTNPISLQSSQPNSARVTSPVEFELMEETSEKTSNSPSCSSHMASQISHRQTHRTPFGSQRLKARSKYLNEADVPFEQMHLLMIAGLPDSPNVVNVLPHIFPNTESKLCQENAHDKKKIVALAFANKRQLIETHMGINKCVLVEYDDGVTFQREFARRGFCFSRFTKVSFNSFGSCAFVIDERFFMIVPNFTNLRNYSRSALTARLKKREVCKFMEKCCPPVGTCMFLHQKLKDRVVDYCPLKRRCPGIENGECQSDHNYPDLKHMLDEPACKEVSLSSTILEKS